MPKVYVEVIVKHTLEGTMRPLSIIWTDGLTYEIDRIKYIDNVGGRRYTCMFGKDERYLTQENFTGKWFVEGK